MGLVKFCVLALAYATLNIGHGSIGMNDVPVLSFFVSSQMHVHVINPFFFCFCFCFFFFFFFFFFAFCSIYCSENRHKFSITPYGKHFYYSTYRDKI